MKILIFTEGTVVVHSSEEKIKDYASYVPIKSAVTKIQTWQNNGHKISYITSRKKEGEVEVIRSILKKYDFPKGKLFYRKNAEEYKDVVDRVKPDILVEDNCESIGAEEIIAPNLDPALKITCIIVPEFRGIDHLPDGL